MAKERLGEILIRAGLLDEAGLRRALNEQRQWGDFLGRHLVSLGLISEETLVRALSAQCKLPAVALDPSRIDPRVVRLLPAKLCERNHLICFGMDDRHRTVDVAMADPSSDEVIEEIVELTRCTVRRYFAAPTAIERSLSLVFHGQVEASGEIELSPSSSLRTDLQRGGPGSRQPRRAAAAAPMPRPLRRDPTPTERQPERLANAVAPPPIRDGKSAARRGLRPPSSSVPPPPPPPSRQPPPPPPAPRGRSAPPLPSSAQASGRAAEPIDEIPLPEPGHVHITLDLPTIQKLRQKENADERLTRVEEMLARDGQLLQLLLGLLVQKGLLTPEDIERIFERL